MTWHSSNGIPANIRVFRPEYLTIILQLLKESSIYELGQTEVKGVTFSLYLKIHEVDKNDNSTIVQGTIDCVTKEGIAQEEFACSIQPREAEDPDSDISIIFMFCNEKVTELVSQALARFVRKPPKRIVFVNEESQ